MTDIVARALAVKAQQTAEEVQKSGLTRVIVAELPEVGNPNTVYMILKTDDTNEPKTTSTQEIAENSYNEYLWIEKTNKYELIGNTRTNLDNYYIKTEVDTSIATAKSAANAYTDTKTATLNDKAAELEADFITLANSIQSI